MTIMLQQIIALILIALFVFRLFKQKKKQEISRNEFSLWLAFWILAGGAVILIKEIDRLVAWLGFSGGGINFLVYLAVLILFYVVFSLRLTVAKLDRNITDVAREIALDNPLATNDLMKKSTPESLNNQKLSNNPKSSNTDNKNI
ncbi:MAG: DUF2304 domain-containing protein [Patescibacteria group bacterium]